MKKKKMTEKQRQLIEDNYSLLLAYCNRYVDNNNAIKKYHSIPFNEVDDLIGHLHTNFCSSAINFDSKKGFKFSTYAFGGFRLGTRNFSGRLKKYCEKNRRFSDINKTYEKVEDEEVCHNEFEVGFDLEYFRKLLREAKMSRQERKVLEGCCLKGKTLREIGEKINLSKERVRQIREGAFSKVKKVAKKKKYELADFYK